MTGEELRIDRWLWCARFFKTRTQASAAVRGGHVRLNGQRVKPAREVKIGAGLLCGDARIPRTRAPVCRAANRGARDAKRPHAGQAR